MHHFLSSLRYNHRHLPRRLSPLTTPFASAHYKSHKPPPSAAPPTPPKPPQRGATFTIHERTWEDPYSWMSNLNDKVAMRHMDVYMEQEEKYTEAVLYDTVRLQSKLQSEMASRMSSHLSTPPFRWGPW